jgi:D-glycero-beta-D-manno-heptose 1-phosphate adenylyltransferase
VGLELHWHTAPVAPGPGTVVATGIFDLLHVGHLRFLRAARAAGGRLAIGVEDDERARARKGWDRPMVPAGERCEMVAALVPVDGVFLISGPPSLPPAPAYLELLSALDPATLAFTEGDPAEGGKRAVAARLGADVLVVPHLQGRSTTWLMGRLLDCGEPRAPRVYAAPITATHEATPGPPSVCAAPRRTPAT